MADVADTPVLSTLVGPEVSQANLVQAEAWTEARLAEAVKKRLGQEVAGVDVAHETSCPLNETRIYMLATKHICRNSCVVPAGILKAIEVTAGIFLPGDVSIQFMQEAI